MQGQKDAGPREILWCVNGYSVVRDGEHPYDVPCSAKRSISTLSARSSGPCWSCRKRRRQMATGPASGWALWQRPNLGARMLRARPTASWALATYRDGAVVDVGRAGLASVEFGVPIDARTRFDIASASKQFTAVSVLLLARDGVLALSDDIRDHLPESWIRRSPSSSACVIPPACRSGLPWWASPVFR
ncbi:serine hydrolase [Streptomyces atratus]|uniref:serine hydrolase n=1 Tax=Streptomyces atratus TaxID=1893 RepID=UPI0022597877|nr:serine hydrolase domain-containing protein [Streptomyces atratus]MCX5345389.1 beta-lactamase family protein [Streptomyces atratus]